MYLSTLLLSKLFRETLLLLKMLEWEEKTLFGGRNMNRTGCEMQPCVTTGSSSSVVLVWNRVASMPVSVSLSLSYFCLSFSVYLCLYLSARYPLTNLEGCEQLSHVHILCT